ncbi:unnamed protein product [Auanema sp. JU1783]|nr:unnamed protein product [Auanema sp. JU1783]
MILKLLYVISILHIYHCENDFDLEPHDKPSEVPCDIDGGEPCGMNEVCISGQTSARVGVCKCALGFTMQNGNCIPSNTTEEYLSNKTIDFEVEGPSVIHLPIDSVNLTVVSSSEKKGNLTVHWDLIMGNGLANSLSYNKETLHLTNLKEGKLQFRVTVTSLSGSSQKDFVLNVLSPEIVNKPPQAMIKPESPVHGVEGSQIVLDAEGSSDENKIISYKWSQDNGPTVNLPALDTPVLKLDSLVRGTYTFTVSVTDSGNLSSSASVTVVIEAERDDPPKSIITLCESGDSGSITVRLPFEDLKLCGNMSTDDKGIVSYSWFRVDKLTEKLAVDSSGSSTNILTLTNAQANDKLGPYEFQLDVTDAKGQKDSSRMSIFVNKAENLPPVVKAGGNRNVFLPETSAVLDALVKDDGSVVGYNWTQISGPSEAVIANKDKSKATVSELKEGAYIFQLEVIDDGGLKGFDKVSITVERSNNEPPIAKANNVTVRLPQAVAILNGSSSTDDAGIITYKWEPSEDVSAKMIILDGSESKPVLLVTGLVKGTHLFKLTVIDQQKAESSISVYLVVEQGNEDLQSVEIILQKLSIDWNYRFRTKLQARLAAVISSAIPEITTVNIHITKFDETAEGNLRAIFWATTADARAMKRSVPIASDGIISAEDTVFILEQEWSMFTEFKIISVQTLYCKLDCSGHGLCSDVTKECVCDRFWMPNLFTILRSGWKKHNCAWSSLYFWLLSFLFIICFSVYLLTKRRMSWFGRVTRRRFRRRKRYSPVRTDSDEEADARRTRIERLLRKAKISDNDQEIVYLNGDFLSDLFLSVTRTLILFKNGGLFLSKIVVQISFLLSEPRLLPLPVPSSSESINSESDDLLGSANWQEMIKKP